MYSVKIVLKLYIIQQIFLVCENLSKSVLKTAQTCVTDTPKIVMFSHRNRNFFCYFLVFNHRLAGRPLHDESTNRCRVFVQDLYIFTGPFQRVYDYREQLGTILNG